MVRLDAALPDVNAHFNHIRNDRGRVAVGVMDDELHAVVMIIAVNLLVRLKKEFRETFAGLINVLFLGTPVVVVEDGVRMQVRSKSLRELELPVR